MKTKRDTQHYIKRSSNSAKNSRRRSTLKVMTSSVWRHLDHVTTSCHVTSIINVTTRHHLAL